MVCVDPSSRMGLASRLIRPSMMREGLELLRTSVGAVEVDDAAQWTLALHTTQTRKARPRNPGSLLSEATGHSGSNRGYDNVRRSRAMRGQRFVCGGVGVDVV
jgi:hypothetical protein